MMPTMQHVVRTVSAVFGIPVDTLDQFVRIMRAEQVLPATRRGFGGVSIPSSAAALFLFAVMRSSPKAAAVNAREVGELVADDIGASLEPIHDAILACLGLKQGVTMATAVGSLIDRFADGSIENVAIVERGIEVEIDRYRPFGSIKFHPTAEHAANIVSAYESVYRDVRPRRNDDGTFIEHIILGFSSPLIYERKISYRVDPVRNMKAYKAYGDLMDELNKYDIRGVERITGRTLKALGALYAGAAHD